MFDPRLLQYYDPDDVSKLKKLLSETIERWEDSLRCDRPIENVTSRVTQQLQEELTRMLSDYNYRWGRR